MPVELPLYGLRTLDELLRLKTVQVRYGIVIVKLHRIEAQFLVKAQFLVERHRLPDRRSKGVCAFMNIPRTE